MLGINWTINVHANPTRRVHPKAWALTKIRSVKFKHVAKIYGVDHLTSYTNSRIGSESARKRDSFEKLTFVNFNAEGHT